MMRIGVDLCSIERISKVYRRFGRKFLEKIMTEQEINYVLGQSVHVESHIAGRFAAKEAAIKALGGAEKGVSLKEFEVVNNNFKAPILALYGQAAHQASIQGLKHWQLSISHEKEFAVAMVLASSIG